MRAARSLLILFVSTLAFAQGVSVSPKTSIFPKTAVFAGVSAGGGIAFMQSASADVTSSATSFGVGAAGSGTAHNWGSNVTSGHLIFGDFVAFNPASVSASDTLTTSLTTAFSAAENGFYQGYTYGKPSSTGADTITFTSGSSIAPTNVALEFSGLSGLSDATPVFSAPASCGNPSACSLSAITTTNANDVVIACAGTNSVNETYTAGSGWTIPSNGQTSGGNQSSFCEYQIVSSPGTYTPTVTMTTATTLNSGTFAFK